MYLNKSSDRLNIKPISLEDQEFILNLVNSEGWLKNIGDRNIKNLEDVSKYIDKILSHESYFYNVVELKATHEKIGIITFLYRATQKYPDFGFAFLPEFENKGFAFEASKIYLNEIFRNSTLDKIIGITMPSNKKSIKLLKKLGFEFEKIIIENEEKLSIYRKFNFFLK
jgi:[ribosomal protein S5]-alanine N-acetyltransferase